MNGFSPNRLHGQSLLASLSTDAPDSRVGWTGQHPTAFLTDELASGHVALMPGEAEIGNPTVQGDDHTDEDVKTLYNDTQQTCKLFNDVQRETKFFSDYYRTVNSPG